MSNIISLVLTSGLEIIGIEEPQSNVVTDVVLSKPMRAMQIPTPQGMMSSLSPVATTFDADVISIPEDLILARGKTIDEVQRVYLRHTSSIEIVNPAQAAKAGLTLVTP